jgi:hypothetical protein
MVAAQQYEIRKPKGRARSREPANSSRGFFLPSGMQSEKGEYLRDPNAKVNEVFTDGAELVVELQDAVEVRVRGWGNSEGKRGEGEANEAKRRQNSRFVAFFVAVMRGSAEGVCFVPTQNLKN